VREYLSPACAMIFDVAPVADKDAHLNHMYFTTPLPVLVANLLDKAIIEPVFVEFCVYAARHAAYRTFCL
jgi:hypothetical protein